MVPTYLYGFLKMEEEGREWVRNVTMKGEAVEITHMRGTWPAVTGSEMEEGAKRQGK